MICGLRLALGLHQNPWRTAMRRLMRFWHNEKLTIVFLNSAILSATSKSSPSTFLLSAGKTIAIFSQLFPYGHAISCCPWCNRYLWVSTLFLGSCRLYFWRSFRYDCTWLVLNVSVRSRMSAVFCLGKGSLSNCPVDGIRQLPGLLFGMVKLQLSTGRLSYHLMVVPPLCSLWKWQS